MSNEKKKKVNMVSDLWLHREKYQAASCVSLAQCFVNRQVDYADPVALGVCPYQKKVEVAAPSRGGAIV